VFAPRTTSAPENVLFNAFIVLLPVMLNLEVALPRVTPDEVSILPFVPKASVPALTTIAPAEVCVALMVSVPAPAFVMV
jgi:hypothetical protein